MFKNKSILLGVSGGIAAYKAAELVRLLVKENATVRVVMTANAGQFVTPLTFQALSANPVGLDLFSLESESRIGHIHQARLADLVILAPATANLMAKMAAGIADDYLTTILLATTAPVLVCPAMNVKMWEHPATRRNLKTLAGLGYAICEPACGYLACREEGTGRLADLSDIMEAAARMVTPPGLSGKRVLVSAGPTWEPFDPVRFLSNPSSGKMGYALARIAARRSARVHLVSGPCSLQVPPGVETTYVTTALEMQAAIEALAPEMDAIVMAAAVSDYRPSEKAPHKLKKRPSEEVLHLEANPDILTGLGRSKPPGQVLAGFAAETQNLVENAREKLDSKNLDFIVANNLMEKGSGFGTDTNRVKILERGGKITDLPPLTKDEVAAEVWDRVERILFGREQVMADEKDLRELCECIEDLRWTVAGFRTGGVLDWPSSPAPRPSRRGRGAAEPPDTPPPSSVPRPPSSDTPPPSEALAAIRASLGDCSRCRLHSGRTNLVFGEGSAGSGLVFVGEGPGFDEDRQGRPFVGRAGKLLDRMIHAIGFERMDTYICNVVKCRPPNNRTPQDEEMAACLPFLFKQLEALGPKVICALGACASQALLGSSKPMWQVRGKIHLWRGIPLICTYHPAYLLRNPAQKAAAWQDLKEVLKILG